MTVHGNLAPTAKLRWVSRDGARVHASLPNFVLQQYWAQDVPSYMQSMAVGEWRDVPIAESP